LAAFSAEAHAPSVISPKKFQILSATTLLPVGSATNIHFVLGEQGRQKPIAAFRPFSCGQALHRLCCVVFANQNRVFQS
jgi:hypothetical protein